MRLTYLQSLKLLPSKVKEMHLQENTLFDFWSLPRILEMLLSALLHDVTYVPARLKLLGQTVKDEIHLQENVLFYIWHWHWSQCQIKLCTVLCKLWGLCSSKVWSCHIKQLRRGKYILTFHLHLGINVTRTAAQCLLNCVAHPQAQFEFATANDWEGDSLPKKTQKKQYIVGRWFWLYTVDHYIMWHMTYAPALFVVATPTG